MERELRADAKETAEHVMLVDLGRNDLGRVCETASIRIDKIMEVERYSHVMHLSSTLTGRLREGLDCWDALRNTLPVGTVSGAPKVRAMQIIDELEPTRRGPYAGGIGVVDQAGASHLAELALEFAIKCLKPGGNFLVKGFQGGAYGELRTQLRRHFRQVLTRKPAASRSRSSEMYLLAKELIGPAGGSTAA